MLGRLLLCLVALLCLVSGGSVAFARETERLAAQPDNLVVNPMFDDSPNPKEKGSHHAVGYTLFYTKGATDIKGWVVSKGSLNLSTGDEGRGRSIQLGENGAISQQITTQAGKQYVLMVSQFVNHDPPASKSVQVNAGNVHKTITHDPGFWDDRMVFVADSSQTTIEFVGLNGGHGTQLNAVYVALFDPEIEGAKNEIERQYAIFERALKSRDFKAVAFYLAPEFQYKKIDGTILSRDQYLDMVQKQTPDAQLLNPTRAAVTIRSVFSNKTTGVFARGRRFTFAKNDDNGTRHEYSIYTTYADEWIRIGDDWKLQRTLEAEQEPFVDGQKKAPGPYSGKDLSLTNGVRSAFGIHYPHTPANRAL